MARRAAEEQDREEHLARLEQVHRERFLQRMDEIRDAWPEGLRHRGTVWMSVPIGPEALDVDWDTVPLPKRIHSCQRHSRGRYGQRWWYPFSNRVLIYCPCGNSCTITVDPATGKRVKRIDDTYWGDRNARRKVPKYFRPTPEGLNKWREVPLEVPAENTDTFARVAR